MRDETKRFAEMYLGITIPQELYEVEKKAAARKLERIISSEGDANGERRKPCYLAQLIAEMIRGDIFTNRCIVDFEDKKRAAHAKAGNSNNQPHYSTAHPQMSRLNCYGG